MNALIDELSKPQYAGLSDQQAADAKVFAATITTLDNRSTGLEA